MVAGAQFLPRGRLGVGLLPWEQHTKALAAITLFHYVGPGEPLYKTVLDEWFARTTEGRGAVFADVPIRELTRPLGERKGRLPRFFAYALRSLRELTPRMVPVGPGPYISMDEAKAEPFFTSLRIKVRNRARGNNWRDDLSLNRVQDLIDRDTSAPYTEAQMEAQYEQDLETDGPYVVTRAGYDLFGRPEYDRLHFSKMNRDWRSFIEDASEAIKAATGSSTELERYSKQARDMMASMGWQPGQGLGKSEDGRTSPIPTPQPPRGGGLGGAAGAARLQGGGKKKLTLWAHEHEPGQVVYGKIDLTMVLNGALAGLVSITAEPLTPTLGMATIIGAVGGVIVVFAVPMLDRMKIDDVVGAIPVHLFCGIWGTLAVLLTNSDATIGGQVISIVIVGVFVFAVSLVVWLILNMVMGIRVSAEDEIAGLDSAELGMEAYPEFGKGSQIS